MKRNECSMPDELREKLDHIKQLHQEGIYNEAAFISRRDRILKEASEQLAYEDMTHTESEIVWGERR